MRKVNRYYPKIPTAHKVRRTFGSASFRQTGMGEYTIIKNGKERKIRAGIEKMPLGFRIDLYDGPVKFGEFEVENFGRTNLSQHRVVITEYRGYNLGKLLFRLAEQESRRHGAKKLAIITHKQRTFTTAISLGYNICPGEKHKIKTLFKIPKSASFPPRKEILFRLKKEKYRHFPHMRLERTFDLVPEAKKA